MVFSQVGCLTMESIREVSPQRIRPANCVSLPREVRDTLLGFAKSLPFAMPYRASLGPLRSESCGGGLCVPGPASRGFPFAILQRSLQNLTSSQTRSHFLRQVKERPQVWQGFVGRWHFLTPLMARFLRCLVGDPPRSSSVRHPGRRSSVRV